MAGHLGHTDTLQPKRIMALAANLLEVLNGAEPQGTNQILDTDCWISPYVRTDRAAESVVQPFGQTYKGRNGVTCQHVAQNALCRFRVASTLMDSCDGSP